jgi:hypothetical protein
MFDFWYLNGAMAVLGVLRRVQVGQMGQKKALLGVK